MEFINEVTMSKNDVKINLTFYFPAVAYALGKKHWPCIRDLFNTISSVSFQKLRCNLLCSPLFKFFLSKVIIRILLYLIIIHVLMYEIIFLFAC